MLTSEKLVRLDKLNNILLESVHFLEAFKRCVNEEGELIKYILIMNGSPMMGISPEQFDAIKKQHSEHQKELAQTIREILEAEIA